MFLAINKLSNVQTKIRREIGLLKRTGIPKATVIELRRKSGDVCSFPGCKTTLVSDSGLLIGEICTIKPISLTGPRYDQHATIEEYYSEENLIYLCPTHHRLVDREPETYTVHFLHQAKQTHEKRVAAVGLATKLNKIEIPKDLSLTEILSFWQTYYDNGNEEFWQRFFSNYAQVIALMVVNPIVKIGEKCYLGGKDIDNHGGNLGDFLFKNKLSNAIVIVEIKTPKTKLLGGHYRTNSYAISTELTGAVVQALNYKSELQKNFFSLAHQSSIHFEVTEPKCIVICGNLEEELMDGNQKRSFDLFRNSLPSVDILTYDELFAKLKLVMELKDGTT